MPELKCTVQTCTHNKNFYCDLERIIVGGSSAKRSEETCCDSFEERKGDSYSDVNGQASACSCIDCKACLLYTSGTASLLHYAGGASLGCPGNPGGADREL